MPNEKEPWNCTIIDHQVRETMQWPVQDRAVLQQMLDHCRQAAPFEHVFEPDAREGYNGVRLSSHNESYTAFLGKLTHQAAAQTTLLTDLGRKLEKLVLSHAPEPYRKQALFILTIDFD